MAEFEVFPANIRETFRPEPELIQTREVFVLLASFFLRRGWKVRWGFPFCVAERKVYSFDQIVTEMLREPDEFRDHMMAENALFAHLAGRS